MPVPKPTPTGMPYQPMQHTGRKHIVIFSAAALASMFSPKQLQASSKSTPHNLRRVVNLQSGRDFLCSMHFFCVGTSKRVALVMMWLVTYTS